MKKDNQDNGFCPFVNEPHEDCYCVKLGSRWVMDAIHYCQYNFTQCALYHQLKALADSVQE